jgi:hypothetical protein
MRYLSFDGASSIPAEAYLTKLGPPGVAQSSKDCSIFGTVFPAALVRAVASLRSPVEVGKASLACVETSKIGFC